MENVHSLEKLYERIGFNFIRASILYLPKTIVMDIEDQVKRENLLKYCDQIFLIEKSSHNYFLEKDAPSLFHVMQKGTLLDDNIYILLQYQDKVAKETFEYILNKYDQQLSGYIHIVEWLYTNVENDIDSLESETLQSFKHQFELYKEHEITFAKQFNTTSNKSTLIERLNSNKARLELLTQTLQDNQLKRALSDNIEPKETRSNKKFYLKELKRKTKQQSEQLILENIFNVQLGHQQ